ncbi:MAG: metallophosphoesterase family protein [Thermotoga caldifontis]|uniref:metallophosphoesterase family protein n=1 Tax=Thermotoga caldifontis TaxID=1508419 RepID=UPI003C79CBC7
MASSTFVIGDVHGCLDCLTELLSKIPLTRDSRLIFLGDYVDRGPDSKGVVETLLKLSESYDCVFIRGNHEQMMLDYVLNGTNLDLWLMNGAGATLRSYGGVDKIPKDHVEFLKSTSIYYVQGNDVFVHAGVRPNVPLEEQSEFDMLWIRYEFIYSENPLPGYRIFFGHTPFQDVLILKDKVGLDTGCVYGNKLSAIALETMQIFQVSCGG